MPDQHPRLSRDLPADTAACTACPLHDADAGRRRFLGDAVRAAALVALAALGAPASAAAAISRVRATGTAGEERRYPVPAADGVQIDEEGQVMLARTAGAVYAFSLACPHQRTALRWSADASTFNCPKHKSRFKADGTLIDGKAKRSLDRFPIRREAEEVVVDTASLLKEDEHKDAWTAAVLKL